MDEKTIQVLLQILQLVNQLAPFILQEIQGISQQTGKTAKEIFAEAGIGIDEDTAEAMRQINALLNTEG